MQLTRLLFVLVAKGLIDILKPVSNPHWKCSGRRKRFHAHFEKWSGWYDCHLALQTHIVHTPLEDTTVLVVIIDHSKSGRDPLVSYLRAHSTNTNRWRFSHNCRTVRSSATTRYAITISGRCTIMEEGVEQSIFNFGVYGSVEHIKEWFCHFNKWE